MAATRVSDYSVSYELLGDQGRPWVITPGGRFSKDSPGVRELATALAERGKRVLIWDRPNCGVSDVGFTGPERGERLQPHPRDVRGTGPAAAERPARRAALGDSEWNERSAARPGGTGEGLFVGWPRLAPALQAWADETAPHQTAGRS